MKKFVLVIGLFITFIIIYLLQSTFFSWFTIAGVKPNIFIILVLFVGLFIGKIQGISAGVLFGLLIDIFINKNIGVSAIMYASIGLLGGLLDKNFSKDSKITIIGMVMISTIIFELGSYIINSLIFSYALEFKGLIITLAIEVVYNSIMTILLYPLIQKVGFSIQDMFRETKILTRYY